MSIRFVTAHSSYILESIKDIENDEHQLQDVLNNHTFIALLKEDEHSSNVAANLQQFMNTSISFKSSPYVRLFKVTDHSIQTRSFKRDELELGDLNLDKTNHTLYFISPYYLTEGERDLRNELISIVKHQTKVAFFDFKMIILSLFFILSIIIFLILNNKI